VILFSSNIKDNPDMPAAHVEHDVESVASAARGAAIVGWQEIGEQEDHDAIDRAFPLTRWFHFFPELAIPITVSKRHFECLELGHERTHGGLARVSPARYFDWVILKRKRRPGVKPFVVINTHFVSGGWTDKPKLDKPWRQEKWLEHFALLQAKVLEFNAKGHDVYVLGDWNRINVDKFVPSQRWLVQHGLDHIAYIPAPGGRVTKLRSGAILTRLFTDHRPIWARVLLLPKVR